MGNHQLRIGLDSHGVCWIVGYDLAQLLGRRYVHIPQAMKGWTSDSRILARYALVSQWLREGKHEPGLLRTIGGAILNVGIPAMCEKQYGERTLVETVGMQTHRSLTEVLRMIDGDHHVYATLVRQALGASAIQRDQGPFAPHHSLVGSLFDITQKAEVVVLPPGVLACLTLLGVKVKKIPTQSGATNEL
ncbi:hypothetical protein D9M68_804810 [compost metagenome]